MAKDKEYDPNPDWTGYADTQCTCTVECGNCGADASGEGETIEEAQQDLVDFLKSSGWSVIFDRSLNDGLYPFCPECTEEHKPEDE